MIVRWRLSITRRVPHSLVEEAKCLEPKFSGVEPPPLLFSRPGGHLAPGAPAPNFTRGADLSINDHLDFQSRLSGVPNLPNFFAASSRRTPAADFAPSQPDTGGGGSSGDHLGPMGPGLRM